MRERWRPVVGFKGFYEVSNMGGVRSVDRVIRCGSVRADGTKDARLFLGRPIRQSTLPKCGHKKVGLWKRGVEKTCRVHRLVMAAFVGPCPKNKEVAHEDGDPANNRLKNLSYKTHTENQRDMRRHGTAPRGERNAHALLTAAKVREIRRRAKKGPHGIKAKLAEEFGVARSTITAVVKRRNWKHI